MEEFDKYENTIEDIRVDLKIADDGLRRGLNLSKLVYLDVIKSMALDDYELSGEDVAINKAFNSMKLFVATEGFNNVRMRDFGKFGLSPDIVNRIGYLVIQYDARSPKDKSIALDRSVSHGSRSSVKSSSVHGESDTYDDDFEEEIEEATPVLQNNNYMFSPQGKAKGNGQVGDRQSVVQQPTYDSDGMSGAGVAASDYSRDKTREDSNSYGRRQEPHSPNGQGPSSASSGLGSGGDDIIEEDDDIPPDNVTDGELYPSPLPRIKMRDPSSNGGGSGSKVRPASTTAVSSSASSSKPMISAEEQREYKRAITADPNAPTSVRPRRKSSIKKQTASWIAHGEWKLGENIGKGSFGEVFKGMNDMGELFAVKRMNVLGKSAEVDDLASEIQLMRGLCHPNIVQYLGAWVDLEESQLYIFQEWAPGGSVAQLLKQYGPFAIETIRNYCRQITCGLEYLHDNGIIHRDIKGGNILLNVNTIKLADFGASTTLGVMDMTLDDNQIKGTPFFMAPEVLAYSKYGRKGDVWAVGCTTIQMLTGEPPWKDRKLPSLVQLHYLLSSWDQGPPPYSREVPEDFREFLELCFAKLAADRPSVAQLRHCRFLSPEEYDNLDESLGSTQSSSRGGGGRDGLEDSGVISGLKLNIAKAANRNSLDDTFGAIEQQISARGGGGIAAATVSNNAPVLPAVLSTRQQQQRMQQQQAEHDRSPLFPAKASSEEGNTPKNRFTPRGDDAVTPRAAHGGGSGGVTPRGGGAANRYNTDSTSRTPPSAGRRHVQRQLSEKVKDGLPFHGLEGLKRDASNSSTGGGNNPYASNKSPNPYASNNAHPFPNTNLNPYASSSNNNPYASNDNNNNNNGNSNPYASNRANGTPPTPLSGKRVGVASENNPYRSGASAGGSGLAAAQAAAAQQEEEERQRRQQQAQQVQASAAAMQAAFSPTNGALDEDRTINANARESLQLIKKRSGSATRSRNNSAGSNNGNRSRVSSAGSQHGGLGPTGAAAIGGAVGGDMEFQALDTLGRPTTSSKQQQPIYDDDNNRGIEDHHGNDGLSIMSRHSNNNHNHQQRQQQPHYNQSSFRDTEELTPMPGPDSEDEEQELPHTTARYNTGAGRAGSSTATNGSAAVGHGRSNVSAQRPESREARGRESRVGGRPTSREEQRHHDEQHRRRGSGSADSNHSHHQQVGYDSQEELEAIPSSGGGAGHNNSNRRMPTDAIPVRVNPAAAPTNTNFDRILPGVHVRSSSRPTTTSNAAASRYSRGAGGAGTDSKQQQQQQQQQTGRRKAAGGSSRTAETRALSKGNAISASTPMLPSTPRGAAAVEPWGCSRCGAHNTHPQFCEQCAAVKPKDDQQQQQQSVLPNQAALSKGATPAGGYEAKRAGGSGGSGAELWNCYKCGAENDHPEYCLSCAAYRR